jgi:hypothetical protein
MDFYKVFRVFIALYLLLSGYGHATYFLRTNDFSAARILGVILRINTLPTILALATDRPYTSYYFAPLVTFWFLAVVLTLRHRPNWNNRLELLSVKVAFAATCTHMLIHTHNILETFAAANSFLFRASIDANNLRSHLSTDNYAPFIGILLAAIHLHIRTLLRTPCTQLSLPASLIKRYFLIPHLLLSALALASLPLFFLLTHSLKTHDAYNAWTPYTSWLPALAFLVLRNATTFLRSRYCAAFAALGRSSLELYLLSQHIWLAGDGRGILRVGWRYGSGTLLGDRWRDLVVLTVLLVWCTWKVRGATEVFTRWVKYGLEDEKAVQESGMELRGWHESADEIDARQGGRSEMLLRVLAVAVVVWLVNLVSLPR